MALYTVLWLRPNFWSRDMTMYLVLSAFTYSPISFRAVTLSYLMSITFSVSYAICFLWRWCPTRAMTSSFLRFLDHTQRSITVSSTPLDEWSARRWDLYLTTHNTHNRQTSMPPVGFEPTISASERPQTYALDRAATGTGFLIQYWMKYSWTKAIHSQLQLGSQSVAYFISLCIAGPLRHQLSQSLRCCLSLRGSRQTTQCKLSTNQGQNA